MNEYKHLKAQVDEIKAQQKAKQEAPLREEIAALTRRVDGLNNAHAAVVSCHHMGEDTACLECMACERYDHHATQRRLAQVAVEFERVAAERDTARELAHDAVQARDRALACEAAGRGLLVELQGRLARSEADALALRGMVADLFELREMLTDDLELLGFGKDDTGAWRVWHVEYPDEGSIPLVETVPAEEPAP